MTEKEKMIQGQLYNSGDPELVSDRFKAQTLCWKYNQLSPSEQGQKDKLIKQLFGSIKTTFYIEPNFRCDYGYNISIGENFYMNYDCVFLDICPITIGDNCMIAPGVHIYTATHPVEYQQRNSKTNTQGESICIEFGKPITIGHNVWIGGRAVILPGVSIGDGAVIASGSIVNNSVPSNTIYGGNPARFLKNII
ncbi:MAG: sugar O-acetyltransferase [Brevinema sp.]